MTNNTFTEVEIRGKLCEPKRTCWKMWQQNSNQKNELCLPRKKKYERQRTDKKTHTHKVDLLKREGSKGKEVVREKRRGHGERRDTFHFKTNKLRWPAPRMADSPQPSRCSPSAAAPGPARVLPKALGAAAAASPGRRGASGGRPRDPRSRCGGGVGVLRGLERGQPSPAQPPA